MTAGRPDYTSQSLIRGSDSGTHRTVAVDAAGNMLTLMRGNYGGSPVTVAVDAFGNILGVLQGDYAGSLKTLAVDAQGRMLAVLTDPEDVFGNPHYLGAGELAARLGASSVFDRRGQVIFQDAGGLNAWLYNSLTSGSVSSFISWGVEGLLSALSYKLLAGAAENSYVQATKYLPRVTTGKSGLEWTAVVDPTASTRDILFRANDGSNSYRGGVRIDTATDKLYRWSSEAAWVLIGALPFAAHVDMPHQFKLVISEADKKYVRFTIDRTEYDWSAVALEEAVELGGPALYLQYLLMCGAAGSVHDHWAGIIVTVNEV